MKKSILAALLLTGAVTASLSAASNDYYVGVSKGKQKSTFDITYSDPLLGDQPDVPYIEDTYNFTVGKHFSDLGRFAITYTHGVSIDSLMDKDDKIEIGFDFIHKPIDRLSLFAGPMLGYSWIEYEDGSDFNGINFGGQAGAIVSLDYNFDLEAGYRYLFETQEYNYDGWLKAKQGDYKAWYFGFNYHF